MKFRIMISILFELLSKRHVKASYLSEKYQVSVRSIYRYIEELENAGVPIYTVRGFNGGFALVDTYKLSATFLTKSEYDLTISSLNAIVENLPNSELKSVINKLKANSKYEYDNFNLKSGNLIIDAGPWGDASGYKYKLAVIQNSIENCQLVKIKYHDRNGDVTERIIEPHIIMLKQGLWYVFAYCQLRNEFRFFKIGRIEYANILNDKFTRRDLSKTDLPLNFWENSFDTVNVLFEINKQYLSDVEEWLGIENVYEKDGKYFAETRLPSDNGLISKIISFGPGIKVLSPENLKNKITECTKSIMNQYK